MCYHYTTSGGFLDRCIQQCTRKRHANTNALAYELFFLLIFQVPVPQSDYYKYEDQPSENGGISSRFTGKLSTSSGTSENCDNQFLKVLHKVNQTIERNEVRLAEQDRRDYIKQEWQQLALVIDRMLMFIFIFGLLTVTIALFSPGNQDVGDLPEGI